MTVYKLMRDEKTPLLTLLANNLDELNQKIYTQVKENVLKLWEKNGKIIKEINYLY